jgi:hypothetical protein
MGVSSVSTDGRARLAGSRPVVGGVGSWRAADARFEEALVVRRSHCVEIGRCSPVCVACCAWLCLGMLPCPTHIVEGIVQRAFVPVLHDWKASPTVPALQ